MNSPPAVWVVVPAAGAGSRIGADLPKQYLTLAGESILDITLANLLGHPAIEGVVIALAEDDDWFASSPFASDPNVMRVSGGSERCYSVANGLGYLASRIDAQQSVLVHDAARPCVTHADLDKLIAAGLRSGDGAVLGARARDSMKTVDSEGRIEGSVPRELLWHAYTPQMFPLGKLIDALAQCARDEVLVTDESSAMERCGYRPVMVEGSSHNIKITWREDLLVAASILNVPGGSAQ